MKVVPMTFASRSPGCDAVFCFAATAAATAKTIAAKTPFYYGAWVPYWTGQAGEQQIAVNLDSLQEVSPFSYEIVGPGTIKDDLRSVSRTLDGMDLGACSREVSRSFRRSRGSIQAAFTICFPWRRPGRRKRPASPSLRRRTISDGMISISSDVHVDAPVLFVVYRRTYQHVFMRRLKCLPARSFRATSQARFTLWSRRPHLSRKLFRAQPIL